MTFGCDGKGGKEGREASEPRCAPERGKGMERREGRERGRNERLLPFGSLNANLLFLHGEADAACHSMPAVGAWRTAICKAYSVLFLTQFSFPSLLPA